MSLRLAVLTNELPPYRRPVFELLAADGTIEVVVIVNTESEAGRTWEGPGELKGVDVRVARSVSRRVQQSHEGVARERTLQVPVSLKKELEAVRPDVILSGEFGPRSAAAALYARRHRVPLILWSEETERAAQSIGLPQRAIRRWLFRRADAFTAWGAPAAAYLASQGIPSFRVFRCAQAVDTGWWIAASDQARARPSPIEKSGKLALSVGQLVPRKGLDVLLRAWSRLPPAVRASNNLAIAGSGPSEAGLKALAETLGVGEVRFLGAKSSEELAALYAHAHLFAFPTWLDVWGLVVNEAMACGLPVIGSLGAGAVEELVEPGVTGDRFEPGDVARLAELLESWLAREIPKPLPEARAKASEPSFEKTVEGIRQAIAFVTKR